jgi:hypothetical protein
MQQESKPANSQPDANKGSPAGRVDDRGFWSHHWTALPIGFFMYMIAILILFAFSILVRVDTVLMNTPAKTIGSMQIWRLLVPFLVCPETISLFCTTFALYMMSVVEENKLGSARYILGFYFKNLFLQVCVAIIGYPFNAWLHIPINSLGVWPMYVLFTTVRCMKDPERESNIYCTNIKVQNKHYPIFLLITYLPFTMFYGLQLDLYIAYGFGILLTKNAALEAMLEPSTESCTTFEQKLLAMKWPIGTVITERIVEMYRTVERRNAGEDYIRPEEPPAHAEPTLVKSEMWPNNAPNQNTQFQGEGIKVGNTSHSNYPPPPKAQQP